MSSPMPDCNHLFKEVQNKLDSTMPWIGLYIAAASIAIVLAIAADTAFSGRFFMPCRFFSLNALSLTVLAVAMKLPVDLTITDLSLLDQGGRITSLIFMCTCMNHFIISLGSMENNEILLNIAALGVLVITVTANVCIHISQMPQLGSNYMVQQQIACIVVMMLLFAMTCSVSLMVPSFKRYMELKYKEMHRLVMNRQPNGSVDEVTILLKGYMVMAESTDPQFLLARSAIPSISFIFTLFMLILSVQVNRWADPVDERSYVNKFCRDNRSNYNWSMKWIMASQFYGVYVASGVHLLRFLYSCMVKLEQTQEMRCRDELKVESYWTSKLVDWSNSPLPFRVQNRGFKKFLCVILRFVLKVCILVQNLFVGAGKLVHFLCTKLFSPILLQLLKFEVSGPESSREGEQYALLLEGESQLPDGMLKRIWKEVDTIIYEGGKKQPENLIRLLRKSANFNGVERFDSNKVPSLHSHEPPNCWSLPVVTLMTIVVALTDISDDEANQLLESVSESLPFVKLIEETLDRNGTLESIRKATDLVWVEVEVYRKWDDKALDSTSVRGETHMETLQNLSNMSRIIVTEFLAQTGDNLMQDPLNWPTRVIAANSMYRIAQTILVGMTSGEHQSDAELSGSISITIADILSACLTNIMQIIRLKCHGNNFKERNKGVRRAALFLGECKEILKILQQCELPSLDVDKVGYIDEWRASMAPDIENLLAPPSTSSDNTISPVAPSTSSNIAISPLASPSASGDNASN